jgi:hypothetical protein
MWFSQSQGEHSDGHRMNVSRLGANEIALVQQFVSFLGMSVSMTVVAIIRTPSHSNPYFVQY